MGAWKVYPKCCRVICLVNPNSLTAELDPEIPKTGHTTSQTLLPLHGGVGRFIVLFIGGLLSASLERNPLMQLINQELAVHQMGK